MSEQADDDLRCGSCGGRTLPGTVTFQHSVNCAVRLRAGKPHPDALDELLDHPPLTELMRWQVITGSRCKHARVIVCNESTERYVECGECEARLDPIAVLAEYAEKDRQLLSVLKSVREARARAAEDHEQIRKATEALKRHRASAIKKDAVLAELVKLRVEVARKLRAHPDKDVAFLRASIRDQLTHLINRTVAALESLGGAT